MLHLLLIEDNPADVLLFREGLRHSSVPADVVIAHDGTQAARMFEELNFRPDFIILDLNLPQFSGLEFLERHRDRIGSPVVVFTSSQNPDDQRRAEELGAVEYVVKPLGFDETIATVREIMERLIERRNFQRATGCQCLSPARLADRNAHLRHSRPTLRQFLHRPLASRNRDQPRLTTVPGSSLKR